MAKQQSTRKRPFGVTAIIVLQLITTLSLAANFFGAQAGLLPTLLVLEPGEVDFQRALDLMVVLFQLVVTIGLWRLQRWAWFLLMIQLGLGMAISLWLYVNSIPVYLIMVISVIMVFYLNQREVQQAFGHRSKPEEAA